MAKKTTRNNQPVNPDLSKTQNYASKPMKIGPVIEKLIQEAGFDEKYLAQHLNRYWRSMYRWYRRTYLTIPEMMALSELLGKNLLLLYHPNVKPEPDPCEPLQKEIEKLRKENTLLEDENRMLKNRIIKQDGQIEILQEQLDKKR